MVLPLPLQGGARRKTEHATHCLPVAALGGMKASAVGCVEKADLVGALTTAVGAAHPKLVVVD